MFDADAINQVYQKIRSKAGNFTCIMKQLNFVSINAFRNAYTLHAKINVILT